MINKILSIQKIKQEKELILKSEKEMCMPLLTDFSQIPVIYKWFKAFMNKRNRSFNQRAVDQRKEFLFVVLYLFAPASMVGYKMPNGLRAKIAKTLHVQQHCSLSVYCEDLIFLFQNCNGFKRDIEEVLQFVCTKLKLTKEIAYEKDDV